MRLETLAGPVRIGRGFNLESSLAVYSATPEGLIPFQATDPLSLRSLD